MPTTLTEHLRALTNEALADLLRHRPDLVVPVPADTEALAARAQARASVGRALDELDEFTLAALDGVRLTSADDGRTSLDAVRALAPEHADALGGALTRLRELFLVYGPDIELRLAGGVADVTSAYPAGLGRPAAALNAAVATVCAEPARLRRELLATPAPARAVLDRLAAGPPVGLVSGSPDGQPERRAAGRRGRTGGPEPDSPVRWLVERHLLAPMNAPGPSGVPTPRSDDRYEAVELPRELGLLLRRESGPLGALRPYAPTVTADARKLTAVDSAGAGQAMEAVRQAEALLSELANEPAALLRSGGVGVVGLRRLARAIGAPEPTAALLVEVAHAAGLAAESDVPGDRTAGAPTLFLLPTPAYDVWRALPLGRRWADLARAWWSMTRQPGLTLERDDHGRPVNVLSEGVERSSAPAVRRAALATLGALPAGVGPAADELLALLAWRRPRRFAGRADAFADAIADAAKLGVTGFNALTSYGRLLLADDDTSDADPLGVTTTGGASADPLAAAIAPLLPAPVDHVLLQADLTLVVPGPAAPELTAELELVAEHESGGGANVYRITDATVRRALDAGYTTADLHELFAKRSRTPVPQSLTYLIDDLGRRHGGLRAGPAGAYLRSDDEALLSQALLDKRLSSLGLRRLAPTVLVTAQHSGRLAHALREAGYAPIAEDASGVAVPHTARARRAVGPAGPVRTAAPTMPALTAPLLAGIVEQIRRGDAQSLARRAPAALRAAQGRGDSGPTAVQAHADAMAVLQQAVRDRSHVWVGYVDAHGATLSRLVRPVSMGAGYLRAEDERTETLHTFALHRITAAVVETP
ncbi:helicase-associated domain-containing protein [Pilimelia columellifera]|uniref:Helicase-associated domain-containing protein n=1 Tax=Pilimelia columellifera subsp. columellifera TaxID=706583 RepID=A0ABP6A319_9ACTN